MPDFTEKLEELHRTPCVGDEVIVVCHRCGYPWKTSSKLEIVSCPSCRVGTRRIKDAYVTEMKQKIKDNCVATTEKIRTIKEKFCDGENKQEEK